MGVGAFHVSNMVVERLAHRANMVEGCAATPADYSRPGIKRQTGVTCHELRLTPVTDYAIEVFGYTAITLGDEDVTVLGGAGKVQNPADSLGRSQSAVCPVGMRLNCEIM